MTNWGKGWGVVVVVVVGGGLKFNMKVIRHEQQISMFE